MTEKEQYETLMIAISQPLHDEIKSELERNQLEDTPQNRIDMWDSLKEAFDGGSMLDRMMLAMIDWQIEQLSLEVSIMHNPLA